METFSKILQNERNKRQKANHPEPGCSIVSLLDTFHFQTVMTDNFPPELPLWRPCIIQQSKLVVQLAHQTQPWDGTQLLHLLFRVWTWTRKSLFCTDGMGLPCELRYQQQRLFFFSLAFSSKNLFFVPHDDWGNNYFWTWPETCFIFSRATNHGMMI